jgi:hypothetical protein
MQQDAFFAFRCPPVKHPEDINPKHIEEPQRDVAG